MPPVIAVTGLKAEARLAAGPRIRVVTGGGERLARDLEAAVKDKASGIISFGIAGGLCPSLAPGARLVARKIVTREGREFLSDPSWAERISAALGGAPIVAMAGVDCPVAGGAARQALMAETGAVSVDTESHIAAGIAAAHDLPFAAFRVVADPAGRELPQAALVAMRPDGGLAFGAIARSILRDPGQIRDVMRVARDARAGFASLFRGRQMLAGRLGFAEFHELLLDVPAEDVVGGPLQV
jgi:hopanoid-associated phosphorylase